MSMWRDLADLLIAWECAHCDRPGSALCTQCCEGLPLHAVRCDPSPRPAGLAPAFAAGEYAGPLRSALLAHKERGARALTSLLGEHLAAAVDAAVSAEAPQSAAVTLVPIPTARRARAERGGDTVLALAQSAAHQLTRAGRPCEVVASLRSTGRRADQSGLGRAERAANMSGAFLASAVRRGSAVIVVDDILTTGATLAAACLALRQCGTPAHAVAAVAATSRRPTLNAGGAR